jgi:hypothetical protein
VRGTWIKEGGSGGAQGNTGRARALLEQVSGIMGLFVGVGWGVCVLGGGQGGAAQCRSSRGVKGAFCARMCLGGG